MVVTNIKIKIGEIINDGSDDFAEWILKLGAWECYSQDQRIRERAACVPD